MTITRINGADHVVERGGSLSTGRYAKYASGYCEIEFSSTKTVTYAGSGAYCGVAFGSFSLPFSVKDYFIDVSAVGGSGRPKGAKLDWTTVSNGWLSVVGIWVWGDSAGSSSTNVSVRVTGYYK